MSTQLPNVVASAAQQNTKRGTTMTTKELQDAVKTAIASGQITDAKDLVANAKAELQKEARQAIERKVTSLAGKHGTKRVPCRITSTGVVVELERHDAIQKIHAGVATLVD